jgi:hypothetical protein
VADQTQDNGNGEKKAKKRPRNPTTFIALVHKDDENVNMECLCDDDGEPTIFEGHRRSDVLNDLINENLIAIDPESGVTPYVRLIPARGYLRLRGFRAEAPVAIEQG